MSNRLAQWILQSRHSTSLIFGLLVGALVFVDCRETDAQAGGDQEAAYRVLDVLVGEWEEEAEVGGQKMTARGSTKWILGRTHLETKFTLTMPDGKSAETLVITTWDAQSKEYRAWRYFGGAGKPLESKVTWNAADKTLTSVGTLDSNVTVTAVTDVSDPDALNWSVEISNADGKVTSTMKGVDRRVKK